MSSTCIFVLHTGRSLEVQFNFILAPFSWKYHCASRQTLLILLPVPRHVTQCSESSGLKNLKEPPPQVFDPVCAAFSTIDSELHQTSPDNSKFELAHVVRPRQEILPIPSISEAAQERDPSQQRSLLHVPLGFSGSLPLFKKILLYTQVRWPLQHTAPTFSTFHDSLHVRYPSQAR